MKPNVLTIAGSDPTGGAGIQADLRTFTHFGTWGLSAVTAITVQNSSGVSAVSPVGGQMVFDQIMALHSDRKLDGIKIGMLADCSVLEAVIDAIRKIRKESAKNVHIVVDPILVSSSGFTLLSDDALFLFKEKLVPLASVLTPNLPEAYALTALFHKKDGGIHTLCRDLYELGATNILLKGGHAEGLFSEDILYDGEEFFHYKSVRKEHVEVHGSGCLLSSALAANLALGLNMDESLKRSKQYINEIFFKSSQNIQNRINHL